MQSLQSLKDAYPELLFGLLHWRIPRASSEHRSRNRCKATWKFRSIRSSLSNARTFPGDDYRPNEDRPQNAPVKCRLRVAQGNSTPSLDDLSIGQHFLLSIAANRLRNSWTSLCTVRSWEPSAEHIGITNWKHIPYIARVDYQSMLIGCLSDKATDPIGQLKLVEGIRRYQKIHSKEPHHSADSIEPCEPQ